MLGLVSVSSIFERTSLMSLRCCFRFVGDARSVCTSTISLGNFGMLKISIFGTTPSLLGMLGITPSLQLNLFLVQIIWETSMRLISDILFLG